LLAAQCAAVAPTLPAPMMLIFARRIHFLSTRDEGENYGQSKRRCNRLAETLMTYHHPAGN